MSEIQSRSPETLSKASTWPLFAAIEGQEFFVIHGSKKVFEIRIDDPLTSGPDPFHHDPGRSQETEGRRNRNGIGPQMRPVSTILWKLSGKGHGEP